MDSSYSMGGKPGFEEDEDSDDEREKEKELLASSSTPTEVGPIIDSPVWVFRGISSGRGGRLARGYSKDLIALLLLLLVVFF